MGGSEVIFGQWTVLSNAGSDSDGNKLCLCRCTCGGEWRVKRRSLLNGSSRRCRNCGRKAAGISRTKTPGYAAITALLYLYVKRAAARGYCFKLTRAEFSALIIQPCFYCGKQPAQKQRQHGYTLLYNGIDRANNVVGYTQENSVPCCGTCNQMKSGLSALEFIRHARAVTQQQELGTRVASAYGGGTELSPFRGES